MRRKKVAYWPALAPTSSTRSMPWRSNSASRRATGCRARRYGTMSTPARRNSRRARQVRSLPRLTSPAPSLRASRRRQACLPPGDDLADDVAQRDGDVPAGKVRAQLGEIRDVTDVVAAPGLVHVFGRQLAAAELGHQGGRLDQRAAVAASA